MRKNTFGRSHAAGWLAAVLWLGVVAVLHAESAHAVPAPTGLRATDVSSRAVALTWSRAGDNAYRVRISTSPKMSNSKTWDVVGNYFEWTRKDGNPAATGPRLSPRTKYYFQVKAIKQSRNSADRDNLSGYGPILAVRTAGSQAYPDLPPVQLSATSGGADTIYLSWRTRGPGVSYSVRYTTNPAAKVSSWRKVTLPAAGGTLTRLKANTKYTFRVRVVSRAGKPLSGYSAAWSRATSSKTASPGLTIASYNVLKTGSGPSWASRRRPVASAIVSQAPDVVALQEATPVTVTKTSGKSVPQHADVLRLIGSPFRYVTTKGSSGTRLAYDSRRLGLVRADAVRLYTLGPAGRYAVWAILRDKVSGKRFFVLNTHLEPGSNKSSTHNAARVRQAQQVIDLIQAHNPNLPVVLAGDLNSSRAAKPENGPYRTLTRAGLVDPLDNAVSSWVAGRSAVAEHLLDPEYNSYNNFERTARRTTYPVGTNADYILVSARVRVAQWRTVVALNTRRQFVGKIPSDHNLLTATVHLP